MKPPPFDFVRPETLAGALQALAGDPGAKVLAGGQSLVPLLTMRLASPSLLVDINGLEELDHVTVDGRGVRVGALARHATVEADEPAAAVQPLLRQALRMVAHPTIRNRGTTVGSLVHADAAAEMPAVLRLLGGTVTAASWTGSEVARREVPAEELYLGPLESSLRHDEIAVEAWFPALAPGAGVACDEVSRRHGDYALCGVAAVVRLDEAGSVVDARAGYLSVCEVPTVVELTSALAGGSTGPALEEAAELALERLDPLDDIHATAAYRRQLARTLTRRVLAAAYDDATRRGSRAA